MLRTGVLQDNMSGGPCSRGAVSNGVGRQCLWRVWARRLVSWLGCFFPAIASLPILQLSPDVVACAYVRLSSRLVSLPSHPSSSSLSYTPIHTIETPHSLPLFS